MAVGQGVLAPVLDVPALRELEGEVELLVLDRCAAHAVRLRTVLRLDAVLIKGGCRESTTAQLAMLEQTSPYAASALLEQAKLLSALPGGIEAVECGLLSEPHAAAVARVLLPASDLVRVVVWRRLQARLLSAFEQGVVLPPARLAELVGGWVIAADGEAAAARRKAASKDGGVSYKRRDDGLTDLTGFGIAGPDAQAVLSRIRDRSRPWGADDDRSEGARRRDAFVSLLLGRDQLPLREAQNPFHEDFSAAPTCACSGGCVPPAVAAGAAPCGCRVGEAVPCGIGVTLLIPLGAALGTTDELAVLEGHGPVEPDLAQAVLHGAPVIRPVWVDEHGVPVAVGDSTSSPPRGDPAAVRQALLDLARSSPPRLHPRHPDDHDTGPPSGHDHDAASPVPDGATLAAGADQPPSVDFPWPDDHLGVAVARASALSSGRGRQTGDPLRPTGADDDVVRVGWWERPVRLPRLLTAPHPTGKPGAYRPPTRMARLVRARSPRCEWPGCGAWAVRCDLDHDRAHPDGPTCGCNLGPVCRHHHRLKQTIWQKTRREDGVRWAGPTGRSWLSPNQHEAPQVAVRPLPPLADLRGPGDPHDDEDGSTDTAWLTGRADRLRADEQDDDEPTRDPFRYAGPRGWGLALDDPTRWVSVS